MIITMTWIETW